MRSLLLLAGPENFAFWLRTFKRNKKRIQLRKLQQKNVIKLCFKNAEKKRVIPIFILENFKGLRLQTMIIYCNLSPWTTMGFIALMLLYLATQYSSQEVEVGWVYVNNLCCASKIIQSISLPSPPFYEVLFNIFSLEYSWL